MAEIAPFRGILYTPQAGDPSRLLSPPYDVIHEADRQALEQLDPHNSVRLILPRDEAGGDGDGRYAAAGALVRSWQAEGVLQRDAQPALYRYHQVFTPPGAPGAAPVTRRGFICRVRLHRFAERILLPHERTLAGPKADRLKLKRATRAHLSQVFGMYDDPERLAETAFAAYEATAPAPAIEGATADGVLHRLWRVTDVAVQRQVAYALRDKRIYIADGHHRYETMLALRDELRAEPGYCGAASSVEYGTIFLCDARDPGLLVFPTHRVVHSLPGFDAEQLWRRAAAYFQVEKLGQVPGAAQARDELAARGQKAPTFLVLAGGQAGYLSLRADVDLSQVGALAGAAVLPGAAVPYVDVALLHALLLEDVLGISRAAQEAQTNLRYLKDTGQALAAAQAADVQAVFLMNPTPTTQVMAVADAGDVMPQKSTYFYPKIASGLVLNPLDPAEPVDLV